MERHCRSKGFVYLKILPAGTIVSCNFGTTLSSHFVKYAKKKNAAAACIFRFFPEYFPEKTYHYTSCKSTNIRNTNSAIWYNTKLLIYDLNSTNTIQIKLTNTNFIQKETKIRQYIDSSIT
jgi:hypothetical protein